MSKSIVRKFHNAVCVALFHARVRLSRFGRAWRYAFRHLGRDDAETIIADCQEVVGQYPLTLLTVEDVLELAYTEFGFDTALPYFVEEACAVVALNWRNNSRDLISARDWALSVVRQSMAARTDDRPPTNSV